MNWEVRTMRSKTSFFNPTLFGENVTRFWPLWVLYTVIWVIVLPLPALNELRTGGWRYMDGFDFHWGLLDSVQGLGIPLAAVFGVLAAMALFSYLYQSRSACMIHSLPIRREGLFLTNYISGLLFFAVPNTVVALLLLLVELAAGDVSLWALGCWWLLMNGACLFFFSFAVLCAQFTGHLLALPALYVIFNGLVAGLTLVLNWLLASRLYGFDGFVEDTLVNLLTPVWGLADAANWYLEDGALVMSGPLVYGVYAAVGVVMAALALALYLRRQVETAGDVIAVPWLRPVFKYGVALCAGLTLGVATVVIVGLTGSVLLWLFVVLWGAAGYFVAEMLLKKSFRVLRGWKGACAVVLVMLVLCAGVELDAFGYEARVPAADQAASVTVRGIDSEPYDDGSYLNVELTDPEDIALVTALHQAVVDQHKGTGAYAGEAAQTGVWYGKTLYVEYQMKDGSFMERRYNTQVSLTELDAPGTVTYAAAALLADPDVVWAAYELDRYESYTAQTAEMSSWDRETGGNYMTNITADPDQAQLLWEAVLQDFREGNLGARYLFDTQQRRENCYFNDLSLYLTKVELDENGERTTVDSSFTVTLTPQASHTLAALEELGVLDRMELTPYGDVVDTPSAEWDQVQLGGAYETEDLPAGEAELLS